MRAKSLAARQSGRSETSDGRRTPPASTTSVTLFSRSNERPSAAAPIRHHACATPRTVSASAAPSSARTKKSRPVARQASIRSRGKLPAPATMPSLPAIYILRLTDGATGISLNKLDNVIHWADSPEPLGRLAYPIAQSAVRREQDLIGIA